MLRADFLGEREKHLERLHRLAASDSEKLKCMADIWISYQSEFEKTSGHYRIRLELKLYLCGGDKDKEKIVKKRIFDMISAEALAQFTEDGRELFISISQSSIYIPALSILRTGQFFKSKRKK
jgi:hypothetical protein